MKSASFYLGSALCVLACAASLSSAKAQDVYNTTIGFFGISPESYPVRSSTGWTNETGQIYTATGLNLAWITPQTGGLHWQITNLSDVTGTGPFLDRYISTTIDPAALFGASEWETTFLFGMSKALLDLNEGFEIRSSMDGFNAPLVRHVGNGASYVLGSFPDGAQILNEDFVLFADFQPPYDPFVSNPDMVRTANQPVEFRFYYWGASPDGASAYFDFGNTSGGYGMTYEMVTVVPIPEPSGALLAGVSAVCFLLRRSRRQG